MALEKTVIGVDGGKGDPFEVIENGRIIQKTVPERIVCGTTKVARNHKDHHFLIGGDREELERHLGCKKPENISILHCREDRAAMVLVDMMKEGKIGGFYTMGNTRQVDVAIARLGVAGEITDLFSQIRIPPLVARVPKSPRVVRTDTWYVLDAGAVLEYKPEDYVALAYLGSVYAEVMGKTNPKVGLLNAGKEATKGTLIVKSAHKLLEALGNDKLISFAGNIEPFPLVNEREKGSYAIRPADVAVCDGFVGNLLIKTGAAFVSFALDYFRIAYEKTSMRGKIGGYCFRPEFEMLKEVQQKCAGAVFLGTNAIKDHGSTEHPEYGLEKCVLHAHNRINELFKMHLKDRKERFLEAYQRIVESRQSAGLLS